MIIRIFIYWFGISWHTVQDSYSMLPTSGWFHHPVFHLPFGVGSQVGTAFQKMWSDAGESGHSESRGKKRRWRGAWGLNDPRNQKCSVGYQHTSVKWLYDVSLLEDIAFQGYDLAVLSTMPGETSRSNGNDIGWPLHRWRQDDVFRVRFCQGYLGISTTGYFFDEQWYQCAFLYLYYQSSLFGTSLRIKTCIKMLVYQPSIHHPTVHSYGLEKPKKSLPARWTGRRPAIRSGAPVPRCCAEKGRVLYTVIWALMDKHNAAPAPAKCILLCSICWWWCWSLEIIH